MTTSVIVAHEKHGPAVYASAVTLLNRRLADGYWYDDEDAEEARAAAAKGEEAAWVFLCSRSDAEYEYVEEQDVIA